MVGFNSSNPTFYISRPAESGPYFDKTGRIAIGNIRNSSGYLDPQAKLHLRSDEGENATLFIEPNNWAGGEKAMLALGSLNYGISSDVNAGFIFRSSADYKFLGGRMGIGNFMYNPPEAKLHIRSQAGEAADIYIEPYKAPVQGGENSWQASLFLGDMENGISCRSNLGMVYGTTQNHLFQGGKVGIGIAEPAALFHVEDNLGSFKYSDAKAIIGAKSDLVSLIFHNSSGDYSISKMDDMLAFMNNDGFQMGLSDTYGLTVDRHIAVGTMANKAGIWPGAGINVVQDGTLNQKSAEFITEEGGRIFFVPRLGNNGSYCPSTVKGDAGIFWSGTTNQNNTAGFVIGPHDTDNWIHGLRINHEGNVAVGLSEPEAKLHVNSRIMISGWNEKSFVIKTEAGDDGDEVFVVNSNGRTWISNKLEAQEIEVKSVVSWSDFVFDENYALRSLSEVEAFINENKHLPDVPSEEEVLENGINLGEMDAILLQKIEELTLYVIELEKKVEKLEKEKMRE